jgi:hypothetical protein
MLDWEGHLLFLFYHIIVLGLITCLFVVASSLLFVRDQVGKKQQDDSFARQSNFHTSLILELTS